jgi:hypothetical protein
MVASATQCGERRTEGGCLEYLIHHLVIALVARHCKGSRRYLVNLIYRSRENRSKVSTLENTTR